MFKKIIAAMMSVSALIFAMGGITASYIHSIHGGTTNCT